MKVTPANAVTGPVVADVELGRSEEVVLVSVEGGGGGEGEEASGAVVPGRGGRGNEGALGNEAPSGMRGGRGRSLGEALFGSIS